jgi:hypothetical protein
VFYPESPRPLEVAAMTRSGLSRRQLLRAFGPMAAIAAVGLSRRARATPITATVTWGPYDADYTGREDSSPAFQKALNAIMSAGQGWGGVLDVPVGIYLLKSPLSCTGSVTIRGNGQASSILKVAHSGTAVAVTCPSNSQCVTMNDIGFSPCPGTGPAGTAVSLNFPAATSAWQHASIHDVDLGVALPGYTSFTTGISATNCWCSDFRDINMQASNISPVPGASLLSLNGKCIDTRVNNIWTQGISAGVLVNSYCEGLHVANSIFIAGMALSTGATSYSGGGSGLPINLLQLFMTNNECNCTTTAANLYQVDTGTLMGNHFGTKTVAGSALQLVGSSNLLVGNSLFTGELTAQSPEPYTGVTMSSSSNANCSLNNVDGCEFTNLLTGVVFQSGATNCSALGIRMAGNGLASLISGPVQIGEYFQQPVLDFSGNSTNFAQCVSNSAGLTTLSARKTR